MPDTISGIARKYPSLSLDSLYRHATKHITRRQMHSAAERMDRQAEAEESSLAYQARKLRAKAIALLLKAENAGDLQTALRGIRESNNCLVTEARLLGELDGPQVNVAGEHRA